jgi:hypothetical protein
MSLWICCLEKNCKLCFNSYYKLKRHQRIIHATEYYRYAHCAISQDKKSYAVRILDKGECISAYQLKRGENQDETIKEVHRRSPSKNRHPVNQFYFEKLEHIKLLIEELQRII